MSAITAVTLQKTPGVETTHQNSAAVGGPPNHAVAGDISGDAAQNGTPPSAAIVEAVEQAIKNKNLQPYVCDSVIRAKRGDELLTADGLTAMRKRLFPLATVVTANRRETAALANINVEMLTSVAAAKDAAKRI